MPRATCTSTSTSAPTSKLRGGQRRQLDDETLDVYRLPIEHLAFVLLLGTVETPELDVAKRMLIRIVEMLIRMCR